MIHPFKKQLKIVLTIFVILCIVSFVQSVQTNDEEIVVATVQPKPQQAGQTQKLSKQKRKKDQDLIEDQKLMAPDLQEQEQAINKNKIKNKQFEQASPEQKAKYFQQDKNAKPVNPHRQPQKQPQIQPAQDQFQPQNSDQEVSYQIDPITENILQRQQKETQQEQLHRIENKLHQWVAEEMDQVSQADNINTHEIFAFQLDEVAEFKWNPTENKAEPLKFVVQIYLHNGVDVSFADNPQVDEFVEVFAHGDRQSNFLNVGKVYTKKMFTISKFTDYQLLRFKNHYATKVLVQVSLQATRFVPEKALDDDNLKTSAQKMTAILEGLEQTEKKRQKYYRSEWSIVDRQQHHQSEMLILTGVELIFILGTAVVQVYCIKNLFDNRLIV